MNIESPTTAEVIPFAHLSSALVTVKRGKLSRVTVLIYLEFSYV